jgi:RNA polymerase sigma-70 factor (ECF subfamily)
MADAKRIEDALQRVRDGDADAFSVVVDETVVIITAYVSFFISDRSLVEDLVQESYVSAFQRLGEYAPGTDFLAWLKTGAKMTALATRRARQRKSAAHERYVDRVQHLLSAAIDEREESHPVEDQLSALRRCIDGLGERAAQMLSLRYFEGLDMKEVARRCDTSAGAIATALHRIRAGLAKCIEAGAQS